jgi:hypothetical protein
MTRRDFTSPAGLDRENPAWGSWSQRIRSGTYDPIVTIVSNADTATIDECHFIRVMNTVIVSGVFSANPTVAGAVQARATLPIPSNLEAVRDLAGSGAATSSVNVAIFADTTNNAAVFEFASAAGAADTFFFTFTYRII